MNFEEFKEGFVAVLSRSLDFSTSEDDSSYLEPGETRGLGGSHPDLLRFCTNKVILFGICNCLFWTICAAVLVAEVHVVQQLSMSHRVRDKAQHCELMALAKISPWRLIKYIRHTV